ncbi:MAG: cation-translocating P-type ATPase [Pseudomonadota bacterium]
MSDPAAPRTGLGAAEAAARLAAHGPNELPRPPRRGPGRILLSVLAEPMFLLLLLAAAIYLAVGDPAEGALLLGFAVLAVGLVVAQEHRSERALEALRARGAPSARVLRDGAERCIPAREVVPGDLLLVGEGERVAADGLLRRADALEADESLLTGESLPVRKRALATGDAVDAAPGGDDAPWAWGGTLVVRGHGVVEVARTGAASAAGRIGASLAAITLEKTLLQRQVAHLVRLFGALAIGVSLLLVAIHGSLRGDWVEAALAGIALAMSMLPEEFPMALAVFMALGARRLAQANVLARRGAVIETLGAASVLAVDKTGTLTENRMRLRELEVDGAVLSLCGDERELPEAFHRLLEFGVLASKRQALDPMDAAVGELGRATLAATEHLHADWPLAREYGLSADLPALSRIWDAGNGRHVVAVKGAPEAVAGLCGFDAPRRTALLARVERMAADGLRVLAVAGGELAAGVPPDDARALSGLRFEGLLGFVDPLRPSVRPAVAEARAAGIAVAMITGDYPATARAIARDAGIDESGGVLTGPEVDAMDAATLAAALRRTRVFARIRPEQKLRLVEAFKADGEVVAMTGDGVNDAPALKAAHIGIAMAQRGTDVAREAASIALLDDDFGRIVAGVRLGRRIFDNLRKVMIYIAAIHLPVAGLALLPLLAGLPPVLLPMHVVLIEMVVDPICSVAFEDEPEERGIMQRPPRRPDEPLVGWPQLAIGFAQGGLLLLAVLAVHFAARTAGLAEDVQRSLAFLALTAGNLALVRVNAARGATLPRLFEAGHRVYWIVTGAAAAIVAACMLWPAAAGLFRFAQPDPAHALAAAATGIAAVLLFDLAKPLPPVRRALGGA